MPGDQGWAVPGWSLSSLTYKGICAINCSSKDREHTLEHPCEGHGHSQMAHLHRTIHRRLSGFCPRPHPGCLTQVWCSWNMWVGFASRTDTSDSGQRSPVPSLNDLAAVSAASSMRFLRLLTWVSQVNSLVSEGLCSSKNGLLLNFPR